MAGKIRSPKYPIVGLKSAIDKLAALYDHIKTSTADNDVAAKAWGYGGQKICGPALQMISTLTQFGLIDRASAGKIKISDSGLDILLPHTVYDKTAAIQTAASRPMIFRELMNQYPEDLPSDDIIKAYLLRRKPSPYTEDAATKIIKSFKETRELMKLPETEENLPPDKETPPPKPPLKTPKSDSNLALSYTGKNITLTVSEDGPSREEIDFIKNLLVIYEQKLSTKNVKQEKEKE
jgi:hypothetical protein